MINDNPRVLVGRYFKDFESAVNWYNNQDDIIRKEQSIVEFKNAYLIVGNYQLKALKQGKMKLYENKRGW